MKTMKREEFQIGGLFLYTATTMRTLGAMASELGDDGSREIGKWGPKEIDRLSCAIRRLCRDLDDVIRDLGGRPEAGVNGDILDDTAMALIESSSVYDLLPSSRSNDGRDSSSSKRNSSKGVTGRHPPSGRKDKKKTRVGSPSGKSKKRSPGGTQKSKPEMDNSMQVEPDSLTAAEVRELLKRQEEHQKQMEAANRSEIKTFFIMPKRGGMSKPSKADRPPSVSSLPSSSKRMKMTVDHAPVTLTAMPSPSPTLPVMDQVIAVEPRTESPRVSTPSSFLSLQDDVVQGLLGLGQGQGFISPSSVVTSVAGATSSVVSTSVGHVFPDMTLNALNVNEEEEEEGLGLDYLQTA